MEDIFFPRLSFFVRVAILAKFRYTALYISFYEPFSHTKHSASWPSFLLRQGHIADNKCAASLRCVGAYFFSSFKPSFTRNDRKFIVSSKRAQFGTLDFSDKEMKKSSIIFLNFFDFHVVTQLTVAVELLKTNLY